MSQTFTELQGTDTLKASRSTINTNFTSLKTNFSGTSAPFTASASTLGATYYNTSDKKTYRVVLSGSNYIWQDINTVIPTQALGDVSTAGANTTFVSKSVNKTNCIIEIPQDINLTLSSGTLTLNSGSVITKPDGTQLQTTSDLTTTDNHDGQRLVFVRSDGLSIRTNGIANCVSGSTDSLAGQAYHIWFDTANTTVNYYAADPSTVNQTLTLPIALVTVSNGAISSIDQVFNGAGYVGHHAFILPGINSLQSNGFNSDGTLKTVKRSSNALAIVELSTPPAFGTRAIGMLTAAPGSLKITYCGEVKTRSDSTLPTAWRYYYIADENRIYFSTDGTTLHGWNDVPFVLYTYDGTSVTKFEISQPARMATVEMLNTGLSKKQDTLTFDTTPTQNSTNPVTSGGVYNKIFSADVVHRDTDTTTTGYDLLTQPINTAHKLEGTGATNSPQGDSTVSNAGVSLKIGQSDSLTTWCKAFYLYGKWNNSDELWYGTRAAGSSGTPATTINWHPVVMADKANTFTGSNTFSGSVSLGDSATATTQATSDDSTKVATTAWVKTTGNGVVHTSGNETVGGNKTLTGTTTFQQTSITQYYKATGYTKGTAPTSDTYLTHRQYNDSANKGVMDEYYYIPKNTNAPRYILRFRNCSSASATSYKDVFTAGFDGTAYFYRVNDDVVTYAPTPTDTTSTSSNKIATVGWVNTVGNNVAHLSGDETIAGTKTFSSTISGSINGNAATVTNGVYTNTAQTISGDKTFSGTTTFSGSVSLGSSATATTPASATDSSTAVATTEWVTGHRCTTVPTTTSTASANAPSVVVRNYYKADTGRWFIVFSDGLIMQGGYYYPDSYISDNTSKSISFSKTFTTTNYSIVLIPKFGDHATSTSGYRCALLYKTANKKTTGFTWFNDGDNIDGIEFIAIGY